jgi:hypothetical protein
MTTHAAAEHAISVANGQEVLGHTIQCSWGTKPTANKAVVPKPARKSKGTRVSVCACMQCHLLIIITLHQHICTLTAVIII